MALTDQIRGSLCIWDWIGPYWHTS